MRRRRLKPARLVGAVAALSVLRLAAAAKIETPDSEAPAVVLEFGAAPQTQRWRLMVTIDGESAERRWSAAMKNLCEFVDADGSGDLDAGEASRLPSAFGIRQMLWGQFVPAGLGPSWTALDADGDRRITRDEVEGYYRTQGVTGVVVAAGRAPHTKELTAALLATGSEAGVLDRSVSRGAWDAALERVPSHDLNGDQSISPAELLGDVAYPGIAANEFISPTDEGNSKGSTKPPVRWRAHEVDAKSRGAVHAVWRIAFDDGKASSNWAAHERSGGNTDSASATQEPRTGAYRIQSFVDRGRSLDMWREARRRFEAQFNDLSSDDSAFVDVAALNDDASLRDFKLVSSAADRNGDRRLSRRELDRWLGVQQAFVMSQTLVSVIDYGAGLFEFVDHSHDGRLSTAELASAWERLGAAGGLAADRLLLDRLPHHLRVTASRGLPSSLLPKASLTGPPWFQAADANSDGRLSSEEFPADDSSFHRLDANSDGEIGAEEAEKSSATKAPSTAARDGRLATLGRRLFFDRSLSSDGSTSCADCHRPTHGWSTPERLPRGVGGRRARRHPPSLYNVGRQRQWFWDGRATSLEEQVLGPIESPDEMNQPVESLVARLKRSSHWRGQFEEAGLEPGKESLAAALAAFCRTIEADDAPYDRFRAGDWTALSPAARRGHDLFFFRLQCGVCHSGENFTDGKFHNLGVGMDQKMSDVGRFVVTGKEEDRGAFKTPSLRNVAKTAPYMHDGRFDALDEVVDFYVRGGHFNPHLDQLMNVFPLSAEEKSDVVAFLREGLTSPSDAAADAARELMARDP
jgi:cytochrome c peroxidase